MNSRRVLALSTAIIFAVSFPLPAYHSYNGFQCFMMCLEGLAKFSLRDFGAWLYYGGFAVSNILLVGFLVLTFTPEKFSKGAVILISIMGLHVLSWLVLNLKWIGWETNVHIGYYVWLLAYVLQTYACGKYRKAPGPAR